MVTADRLSAVVGRVVNVLGDAQGPDPLIQRGLSFRGQVYSKFYRFMQKNFCERSLE